MERLFKEIKNELDRLKVVEEYELFDTSPEAAYDNITFLASQVCQTPISTITLVDEERQWFKSKVGFTHDGSPKATSFCALAISKPDEVVVVTNLMEDPEFSEIGRLNGLESGGFYAGVIITNEEGVALGTLCVIDYVSKTLTENQVKSLVILAKQVSDLFKIRFKYIQLRKSNELLKAKYEELAHFASTVSHDLKSPLNNIISLVQLVKENNEINDENSISENATFVEYMVTSTNELKKYIDDLLDFYKNSPTNENKAFFEVGKVFEDINNTLNPLGEHDIHFETNIDSVFSHEMLLKQILFNLVSNGIKYNKSEKIVIHINFEATNDEYIVSVADNGIGIKKEDYEIIFKEFQTLAQKDRFGNYGKGLGLSRVKKLVDMLNGSISIESTIQKGSIFKINWSK